VTQIRLVAIEYEKVPHGRPVYLAFDTHSHCRDGREIAALAALLDEIEEHPERLRLDALAAVVVAVAQSPKVQSVVAISDWPWPLAAAAGAKAGLGLLESAQAALQCQEDIVLRGLALRFLALTIDIRQVRPSGTKLIKSTLQACASFISCGAFFPEIGCLRVLGCVQESQAVVKAIESCMGGHVATDHTAAAFAVLAIVRRQPRLFASPELLNAVLQGLGGHGFSEEARGYLLQACW
jgi:hypothetical protein